jgi:hypothetical protein
MSAYYRKQMGKLAGPISLEQVNMLSAEGVLDSEEWLWDAHGNCWVQASSLLTQPISQSGLVVDGDTGELIDEDEEDEFETVAKSKGDGTTPTGRIVFGILHFFVGLVAMGYGALASPGILGSEWGTTCFQIVDRLIMFFLPGLGSIVAAIFLLSNKPDFPEWHAETTAGFFGGIFLWTAIVCAWYGFSDENFSSNARTIVITHFIYGAVGGGYFSLCENSIKD